MRQQISAALITTPKPTPGSVTSRQFVAAPVSNGLGPIYGINSASTNVASITPSPAQGISAPKNQPDGASTLGAGMIQNLAAGNPSAATGTRSQTLGTSFTVAGTPSSARAPSSTTVDAQVLAIGTRFSTSTPQPYATVTASSGIVGASTPLGGPSVAAAAVGTEPASAVNSLGQTNVKTPSVIAEALVGVGSQPSAAAAAPEAASTPYVKVPSVNAGASIPAGGQSPAAAAVAPGDKSAPNVKVPSVIAEASVPAGGQSLDASATAPGVASAPYVKIPSVIAGAAIPAGSRSSAAAAAAAIPGAVPAPYVSYSSAEAYIGAPPFAIAAAGKSPSATPTAATGAMATPLVHSFIGNSLKAPYDATRVPAPTNSPSSVNAAAATSTEAKYAPIVGSYRPTNVIIPASSGATKSLGTSMTFGIPAADVTSKPASGAFSSLVSSSSAAPSSQSGKFCSPTSTSSPPPPPPK